MALYAEVPLRAFENEYVDLAFGAFWDPAGVTDDSSAESFQRCRHTELTHGRFSMLAIMGYALSEISSEPQSYVPPSVGVKSDAVQDGPVDISEGLDFFSTVLCESFRPSMANQLLGLELEVDNFFSFTQCIAFEISLKADASGVLSVPYCLVASTPVNDCSHTFRKAHQLVVEHLAKFFQEVFKRGPTWNGDVGGVWLDS